MLAHPFDDAFTFSISVLIGEALVIAFSALTQSPKGPYVDMDTEDEYFIPKDFGRRLSEKWVEENGERFHPGLAVPPGLIDQRAVFVPRESPQ